MGGEDEENTTFLVNQSQAIGRFLQYYDLLPDSEKLKIPKDIKEKIQALDKIAKLENQGASCVDILQKQLRELVNAHQETLGSITLHNKKLGEQPDEGALGERLTEGTLGQQLTEGTLGTAFKAALEKAQEALKQAQATLEKALSSQPLTYQGKDQAGLTTTLLQALGVSFTIQADRDLKTLHASSP